MYFYDFTCICVYVLWQDRSGMISLTNNTRIPWILSSITHKDGCFNHKAMGEIIRYKGKDLYDMTPLTYVCSEAWNRVSMFPAGMAHANLGCGARSTTMSMDEPWIRIGRIVQRGDGVSYHCSFDCLLNRLFRRRPKKTSKLRVTGLCEGIHRRPVNSPQRPSNAENVSVWWRHHDRICSTACKKWGQMTSLMLGNIVVRMPHHSLINTFALKKIFWGKSPADA